MRRGGGERIIPIVWPVSMCVRMLSLVCIYIYIVYTHIVYNCTCNTISWANFMETVTSNCRVQVTHGARQ